MNKEKIFLLKGRIELNRIEDSISSILRIKKSPEVKKELIFYDTFDWLFYSKGFHLFGIDNTLKLYDFKNNTIIAETDYIPSGDWFYCKSLSGAMAEMSAKISASRAIRIVTGNIRTEREWEILDNDDKTAAILKVLNYGDVNDLYFVIIIKIKGYKDISLMIETLLKESGFEPEIRDELSILMTDSDNKPMSYSSKMNLEIDPELSSGDAAVKILNHFLSVMKLNENGIISDIDSEFLHDYRIAVRKSRSFISIVKNVLPENTEAELKDLYKVMSDSTNNLRDMDVLIKDRESYQTILPSELTAGLNILFRHIEAERSIEQKKVSQYILSDQYKFQIKWIESLILENNDSGHLSKEPVSRISAALIMKRYKTIKKTVLKTDSLFTDEDIHKLRIDFKKFRYLLEFFSSLYPEKEVSAAVKKLKIIQEELGIYNDLSVQHSLFADLLKLFIERGDASTASSIGGIMSVLDTRKKKARDGIMEIVLTAVDVSIETAIRDVTGKYTNEEKLHP